jgi:hypothetical protein
MTTSQAWLLDLGASMVAAIGVRELVQIVDAPLTFAVPLTPACSRHVMFWQKRMLPVLDLSIRLNAQASAGKLLAIIAYQNSKEGGVGLGAIRLASPPVRITVDDDQACPLEQHMVCWFALANSSFQQNGAVIPVLHLSRLFGARSDAS